MVGTPWRKFIHNIDREGRSIKMCTLSVCLNIFGQSFNIKKTVVTIGAVVTLHALSAILVCALLVFPEIELRNQTQLLQCIPLDAAWEVRRQPDKCVDRLVMSISQASINLALDCVVYSLPLILVLKSPIDARKKSKQRSVQVRYRKRINPS